MAEMRVERQSVGEYLSKNSFLIPMYQRPYTWKEDHCEQLWEDIVNFHFEKLGNEDEYFLGTSVLYKDKGLQNLIDGQQRTTTLALLIRALYQKAYKQKSDETQGLVSILESCLWKKDEISGKPDYKQSKLRSEVAIDSDCEILEEILSATHLDNNDNFVELKQKANSSKYAKNFLFFIKKSDDFAKDNPTEWQQICITILNQCVILPIECDQQENALRIFNTLNNRGIPLSDSDIFKGIIFASKKSEGEKKQFAQEWKQLEKDCKESEISADFIFNNYMHIIRARNGDKSNVIGLRRFFTEIEQHKKILKDSETFKEIQELTQYWCGKFDAKLSPKANQFYEILNEIPNDHWKFLDSAYYFYFKDSYDMTNLENFLSRMVANFLVKLIDKPTIAAVKPITFNAYTSLYNEGIMDFKSNARQILDNRNLFREQFFKAKKLIPALLTLNLHLKYPSQKTWIPAEIEHICPKTTNWRPSYTGWNKDEAELFVESIGNKMWLEKKLNIKASNGYFDEKKEKYSRSNFLEAQEMAKSLKNDWVKEDIKAREEEIFARLYQFFVENI